MKVLGIAVLAAGGIIIGTVTDFILKNRSKPEGKQNEPEMAVDTEVLHGIVTEITLDHETGLTKISVKDSHGRIRYGFSSIPPARLEQVYMGKGWMQVPILRQTEKK